MTPLPVAERLEADVVVVGSGGAGLCAAAAACRAGARTVLVTKARAGLANCTAYAGGRFTVAPPQGKGPWAEPPLSPPEHFAASLAAGRGLNDRALLRELCEHGTEALLELERHYGVEFDWQATGCSVSRHGRPPLLGGVGLTRPLVTHLRRTTTRLVENAVVTEIVREGRGEPDTVGCREGGRVLGVLAVLPTADSPTPGLVDVRAPAVVVATGGGGAVYGRTDNPPRMTGDGYDLLLRAGGVLEDMEFVQFYPLAVAEPGLKASLLRTLLIDYVRLTDETGAEPLAGKLTEWGLRSGDEASLLGRDRVAVALARRIAAGHTLYLHTEEIAGPGPAWVVEIIRGAFPASFDPLVRAVRVAPIQHYFCGGAAISPKGEVLGPGRFPLPGLYACGEAVGGVDGANRVGGNALSSIVVFGLAAGRAAAEFAARTASRASTAASALAWRRARDRTAERVGRWVGARSGAGVTPLEHRSVLRGVADRFLGPVRTPDGLRQARVALDELRRQVGALVVRSPADLLLALELGPAVTAASLVADAALTRTESRGPHFREDHPDEAPDWLRPVVVEPASSGWRCSPGPRRT